MDEQTRVSGLMTNAPLMLNVDCDMYANNPQIVYHALCLLLGTKYERDCAFVQCPQYFYDGAKDDPFGNQLVVRNEVCAILLQNNSYFEPNCSLSTNQYLYL